MRASSASVVETVTRRNCGYSALVTLSPFLMRPDISLEVRLPSVTTPRTELSVCPQGGQHADESKVWLAWEERPTPGHHATLRTLADDRQLVIAERLEKINCL